MLRERETHVGFLRGLVDRYFNGRVLRFWFVDYLSFRDGQVVSVCGPTDGFDVVVCYL